MTAARKLPVPAPKRTAPKNTHELFAEGLKRVDVEGLAKADKEYGDDFARELADIEAGKHPLQRRPRAR